MNGNETTVDDSLYADVMRQEVGLDTTTMEGLTTMDSQRG